MHEANSTFIGCDKLLNFTTASTNKKYAAVDGVLYSRDLSELVLFPRGRSGTYTLLNKVTKIKEDAFSSSKIESFVCPIDGKLTRLEVCAFEWCDSLISLNLCKSVKTLDDYCIYHCRNLASLSFDGTKEEWNKISKTNNWYYDIKATEIECSNGKVAI